MAFCKALTPVKNSPEYLPDYGLGCAPIGGLYTEVSEEDAHATIHTALQLGLRFFDTAPHYGAGLSENRLGVALNGIDRDSVSVATKVGRLIVTEDGEPAPIGAVGHHTVFDLSRDAVLRSLESSLSRLQLSRIDVLYLHDPENVDAAIKTSIPTMIKLRDEGLVRLIGVGMNYSAPLARFAAETGIDIVMVAGRYTLLDRSAEAELFPATQAAGVDVIAAGVLNTGILANPHPGSYYNYQPAPTELLVRAQSLESECATFGVRLATAAIQFPLQHPAVSGVVVGARTAAEVRQFVTDARVTIPKKLRDRL